jgi:GNAT superfamily N-acetyltransferase
MSSTHNCGARPADRVTFRRLALMDEPRLATLAEISGLRSLYDNKHRRMLLKRGVVLAALGFAGDVIGCSCIEPCATRSYAHLSGGIVSLPPSNAYLCGTFVHPAHRGHGIGTILYLKRLELVEASGLDFAAVEILGEGVPYSLNAGARPGFVFHTRTGFAVDGYSIEEDRGPVLVRRGCSDVFVQVGGHPTPRALRASLPAPLGQSPPNGAQKCSPAAFPSFDPFEFIIRQPRDPGDRVSDSQRLPTRNAPHRSVPCPVDVHNDTAK